METKESGKSWENVWIETLDTSGQEWYLSRGRICRNMRHRKMRNLQLSDSGCDGVKIVSESSKLLTLNYCLVFLSIYYPIIIIMGK